MSSGCSTSSCGSRLEGAHTHRSDRRDRSRWRIRHLPVRCKFLVFMPQWDF